MLKYAAELENQNKKSVIIAVDFDGTLVTNAYPEVGEPIQKNIDFVKALKDKGCKLILWTCREGEQLADAVTYLKDEHDLEFDAVNENIPEIKASFGRDTRKIVATYYFDDKGTYDNKTIADGVGMDKYAMYKAIYKELIKMAVGDTPIGRMALAAKAALGLKQNSNFNMQEPGLKKKTTLKPEETGFDDIPLYTPPSKVLSKRMTPPPRSVGNMNTTNTQMRYTMGVR